MSDGAKYGCDAGITCMLVKMPRRPSVSSWLRPTWSGRNLLGTFGWPTNHHLTKHQKRKDC